MDNEAKAKEIADKVTRAQDDLDRIGGLYEMAFKGALLGLDPNADAAAAYLSFWESLND